MIKEILEESQAIKELIEIYCLNRKLKRSPYEKFYFALTKDYDSIGAIGYTYENFEKCENYQNEYDYYQTSAFEYLLYNEITNKNLKNTKEITKLAIILLTNICNINLEEHLNILGLNIKQYNQLLDEEVEKIKGTSKTYNRTSLLGTFNLEENFITQINTFELIKDIELEEIPYE